jgi:GntR family transcriptional regulator
VEQRYAAIAKALVSRIAAGTYPVGSLLPGETELAEAFGVSRGTLRAALDQVQDLGLISRKKRAGTRVEARLPPVAVYEPTISSVDELIQYTAGSSRTVDATRYVVADAALAARLGCAPGTGWLEVQASRAEARSGVLPMGCWTVYVQKRDGTLIRSQLRTDQRLISDLIQEATGRVLNEVRQTVRAVGVPDAMATRLGVEIGSPALEFTRRYYDQSHDLFQIAISIHPGPRSAYTTVLKRQAARDS